MAFETYKEEIWYIIRDKVLLIKTQTEVDRSGDFYRQRITGQAEVKNFTTQETRMHRGCTLILKKNSLTS